MVQPPRPSGSGLNKKQMQAVEETVARLVQALLDGHYIKGEVTPVPGVRIGLVPYKLDKLQIIGPVDLLQRLALAYEQAGYYVYPPERRTSLLGKYSTIIVVPRR